MKKTEKRGLAPRSLVTDDSRRSALASLDRPSGSAATAFVRAALDAPALAPVAPPAPAAERILRRVPLHEIGLEQRRFQYRVSRSIAKLTESLLLQGQQVPVILRGSQAPYEIVSGFGPIMPAFQGQVNEEQLLQLVAYVKSLSTSKPETAPANTLRK